MADIIEYDDDNRPVNHPSAWPKKDSIQGKDVYDCRPDQWPGDQPNDYTRGELKITELDFPDPARMGDRLHVQVFDIIDFVQPTSVSTPSLKNFEITLYGTHDIEQSSLVKLLDKLFGLHNTVTHEHTRHLLWDSNEETTKIAQNLTEEMTR